MPVMITVTPKAIAAVKTFIEMNNLHKPIRIHLRSTGCCDASLGLMLDNVRKDDRTEEIQGMLFVIGRELEKLTGDVAIAYTSEAHRTGFILTSENPVSEWSGFGVCKIDV